MTTTDGDSFYSKAVLVNVGQQPGLTIQGFARDEVIMQVNSSVPGKVTLVIVDVTGRQVKKHFTALAGGRSALRVPIPELARGIYYLLANTPQGLISAGRFLKE
ncbi:MAG: hypothetical protein EOO01_05485 [Chitinophagaceae bacterium]|nr:MAG: hypothetical protein EOO01_05485 [Chitinophagaceae bacterium]